MFLHLSVSHSVHGGGWQGACMVRGCVVGEGHAWQGGMPGRGGPSMAGGACVVGGVCVAGETATAADGTHPTGMPFLLLKN